MKRNERDLHKTGYQLHLLRDLLGSKLRRARLPTYIFPVNILISAPLDVAFQSDLPISLTPDSIIKAASIRISLAIYRLDDMRKKVIFFSLMICPNCIPRKNLFFCPNFLCLMLDVLSYFPFYSSLPLRQKLSGMYVWEEISYSKARQVACCAYPPGSCYWMFHSISLLIYSIFFFTLMDWASSSRSSKSASCILLRESKTSYCFSANRFATSADTFPHSARLLCL